MDIVGRLVIAGENERSVGAGGKAEPELLAIDGFYRTAEDIDASLHGRAIQAWLDGDALRIAGVD